MHQSFSIHSLLSFLVLVITSLFTLSVFEVKSATYNSTTGELFLPHLINGSETLTEVTLKLNTDGTYAIQSGTKSALPFHCPGEFSKATFDKIKSAKDANEIDSLLGCRWHSQQTSDDIPVFSWLDSSCQSLSVVIDDSLGGNSSSLEQNYASCKLYSAFLPYDLASGNLYLQYVKIDNTATASEVYIKLYDNKYEIVNYQITPNTNPPVICDLLTEADYDAISATMALDEINNKLGCKWAMESVSEDDSNPSYVWVDHEWNQIRISNGDFGYKLFLQFRVGETPDK